LVGSACKCTSVPCSYASQAKTEMVNEYWLKFTHSDHWGLKDD
jgi:hypothetical protein